MLQLAELLARARRQGNFQLLEQIREALDDYAEREMGTANISGAGHTARDASTQEESHDVAG